MTDTSFGELTTDVDFNIVHINDGLVRLSGYSGDELIGATPKIFQSGMHSQQFYNNIKLDLMQYLSWKGIIWNRRKDGQLYLSALSISARTNGNGRITRYHGVCREVTEDALFNEAIRKLTTPEYRQTALPDALVLTGKSEILEKLQALPVTETKLVAVSKDLKRPVACKLVLVNALKGFIVIEPSISVNVNTALLAARELSFRTQVNGVRMEFPSQQLVEAFIDTRKVIAIPIPSILYWLKFRSLFRLSIPDRMRVRCLVPLGRDNRVELPVRELSVGGLALMDIKNEFPGTVTRGQQFHQCKLYLKGFENEVFSIEFCHSERCRYNESLANRFGFRIVGASARFEIEMQKLMYEAESDIRTWTI